MRIVIADDDMLVSGALRTILEKDQDIEVQGIASNGKEAIELYRKYEPDVLLMDEPTSALDPISTAKIEELALELKKKYTIAIVTHNMQQAARISDQTAFFLRGEMVECAPTKTLFDTPTDPRTRDYITGRFG